MAGEGAGCSAQTVITVRPTMASVYTNSKQNYRSVYNNVKMTGLLSNKGKTCNQNKSIADSLDCLMNVFPDIGLNKQKLKNGN